MTGQKMKEMKHKHILKSEIDLRDFDSLIYWKFVQII